MAEIQSTIPKDSWVLVTGVNGYVASQVAKSFLERGYKVRGTVRDIERASWIVNDALKIYANRGDFTLVTVEDFGAENAFRDAVKGVSAIAHVATNVSMDPNPEKVIPQTVAAAVSIMEAAIQEPSVKEFVYTSSIVAATPMVPDNPTHVEQDTWNNAAVETAWNSSSRDIAHGQVVYMASKTEAEKALWKFVEERRPNFSVNSICPAVVMGEPLSKTHLQSPASWIKQVYDGRLALLKVLPAGFNIDVKDVAQLHVAAVLDPNVKSLRLQAWGDACNWNDVLSIMRRLYPEHKFIDDLPGMRKLSMSTDLSQPLSLLKRWTGQSSWRTLEQTVKDNTDVIIKWDTEI